MVGKDFCILSGKLSWMNYISGLKSGSASESLGEYCKDRFLDLTPQIVNLAQGGPRNV